jgi:integrase
MCSHFAAKDLLFRLSVDSMLGELSGEPTMPRYNSDQPFQIGDFWLSKRAKSDAWYRTWFDSEARQTRRISLGTPDFDEAKQALTDWFVLYHTKTEEAPEETTLAELFARYYEQYGSKLRSRGNVQRYLRYWLDFHKTATVKEACALHRQQAYRDYLANEVGLGKNSIRQVLTIGKAALNWAWKRSEISSVPYIKLVKVPNPPPKGRPLEIEEVATLIDAADYHLKAFILMMISATARNRAILDLTFEQVDFRYDLVDLNPKGREQTLKFRPKVKIPGTLKPWLARQKEISQTGHVIEFKGAPVKSIRTAWRTLRQATNLDDAVQPYGLRHTMARWLRKSSVPAWEVAAQLGHKSPDVSTTEIYAPFDPSYLLKSTAAIDAFLTEVALHLRYNSISDLMFGEIKVIEKQGGKWWFGGDLNSRPRDYESRALTS